MMNDCEKTLYTKAKQQLPCNHPHASIHIIDMYKIDNVYSEATVSCRKCQETATFSIDTDVYYGVWKTILEV
jgi:hypothetical protein